MLHTVHVLCRRLGASGLINASLLISEKQPSLFCYSVICSNPWQMHASALELEFEARKRDPMDCVFRVKCFGQIGRKH